MRVAHENPQIIVFPLCCTGLQNVPTMFRPEDGCAPPVQGLPRRSAQEDCAEAGLYDPRDERGKVTTLSAKCTHMGCSVKWNPAEKTWDCPAHGSRFTATGEVFHGPAHTGLSKKPE